MRRMLGWIFLMALRMKRGWSIGRKRTWSVSGRQTLAVSFPIEVIVVKTIFKFGNSFLIFFIRGTEQKTSPTDAAWTQMGFLKERFWKNPIRWGSAFRNCFRMRLRTRK
jgi:hypothetical protein